MFQNFIEVLYNTVNVIRATELHSSKMVDILCEISPQLQKKKSMSSKHTL